MNRTMAARLGAAALLATTAGTAGAQTYPKPQGSTIACDEDSYRLVPAGSVGPWRQSFAGETGYDAAAPVVACGPAANAQPLACVNGKGEPARTDTACIGKAMADYDASGTGRTAVLSYSAPFTYNSVARADLGSCQQARHTWRSTPTAASGGCGTVQVPVTVQCVNYDTGAAVGEAQCNPATRPASSVQVEDRSGCTPSNPDGVTPTPTPTPTPAVVDEPPPPVAPVVLQLGRCRYTSSGGGRYACGEGAYVPNAPFPRDLCSGRLLAGAEGETDFNNGIDYQSSGGTGWAAAPLTRTVPGAQCVVQWKTGYSNSRQTIWVGAYYSGRPTGVAGGLFIGKN